MRAGQKIDGKGLPEEFFGLLAAQEITGNTEMEGVLCQT
jgi:hypothetical protein